MTDRYKLHQFYQGESARSNYLNVQAFTDEVYQTDKLQITMLGMDLLGKSLKQQKEIESKWLEKLPSLDNIKALSIRHRANQEFFDAICKMRNLESLFFWTSTAESISSIISLSNLRYLKLWRFNRLKDILPLVSLKRLTHLSIDGCFAIKNYEVVGQISQLIGLELCGDSSAPKNLRIKSLKPYESLQNLKHLDLSSAFVVDKSYESVLAMKSLERFDLTVTVPKSTRDKIKTNHQTLQAGFFIDWDFENKRIYEGKNWQ